jgi:membrane-associated protease RseP (regulator of RpoE activity)
MFTTSETTTIIFIVVIALGVLGWGFNRARAYGKLGILSWLQSVALIVPWLVFFGLIGMGIYLNLVGILFLLVVSTGFYIWLGRELRAAGQDALLRERAAQLLQARMAAENPANSTNPENADKPVDLVMEAEDLAIPDADLKAVQGIFGIDTFFATKTIPYEQGVIFQGNLRGEAGAVHEKLSATLKERLSDRYRLFLVENPEGKPVVIVLPASADPQPLTKGQKILASVLFLATLATTGETVGLFFGFDLFSEVDRFQQILPVSIGIWLILAAHEIAHQVMAKQRGVKFSLPFFIPSLQIATFGAINRFQSLLPSRSTLFDVAIAGPAAGGITSVILLITGLLLSHAGSAFQMPTEFFQGSILVGTLAKVVLGSALQEKIVDVHPLVIVGWLGLVLTALNLMPAGQLDGGRIVQAIYGRKTAQRTTIATLILLGIVSFINPANPVILYWLVIIAFLQRGLERPTLNEISEPDDARAALGLLALFLMIATIIPLAPGLAGKLGIGG